MQACMPAIRVQLHAVRRYVQVDPTEYDPAYVSQQLYNMQAVLGGRSDGFRHLPIQGCQILGEEHSEL